MGAFDYDELTQAALCVVSIGAMIDKEELKEAIKEIKAIIGTGYYNGDGDGAMEAIVKYWESQLK